MIVDVLTLQLMRDLPGLSQNVREPPFCLPYCAKARVLLSAHFSRKDFPAKTLELGESGIYGFVR
jgi:hypothetical protein